MPNHLVVALSAAICISGSAAVSEATLVSEFPWNASDVRFGGLSGLELSDDGAEFLAIGDRGLAVRGRFVRQDGAITSVEDLRFEDIIVAGGPDDTGTLSDAEGLAGDIDGPFHISFESAHRVDLYAASTADPSPLTRAEAFRTLFRNGGLEALAIDDSDRIWAIPENQRRSATDVPVYRHTAGTWDIPFRISRTEGLDPVGADFGPDGMLYVLERSFHGIFGFASRVRRFGPDATGVVEGEVLLHTRPGNHDNLEGIALWRDEDGALRLTMVSDDNFNFIQRTEFVEYRLTD